MIVAELPLSNKPILEIGSGAGFLDEYIPNLIASELLALPDIDAVLDAQSIPLLDGTLGAVVMINVFHHLPQPRSFFAEITRCVEPGGRVVMIEPWVTPFATLVYSSLHHEPFLPDVTTWEFGSNTPLSSANGALPWIVFVRDVQLIFRP